MEAPQVCPRVNAAQLGTFTGQRVSFVGKVQSHTQGVTMMQSAEGTPVTVQSNNQAGLEVGGIYEIIGSVNPDCSIYEEQRVEYSDKFGESFSRCSCFVNSSNIQDLSLYNSFLQLAHGEHSQFFYAQ